MPGVGEIGGCPSPLAKPWACAARLTVGDLPFSDSQGISQKSQRFRFCLEHQGLTVQVQSSCLPRLTGVTESSRGPCPAACCRTDQVWTLSMGTRSRVTESFPRRGSCRGDMTTPLVKVSSFFRSRGLGPSHAFSVRSSRCPWEAQEWVPQSGTAGRRAGL